MQDELFDLVDEDDVVVGTATRSECHGNPKLIHRAVHVLVFNSKGQIYLQKRSNKKIIQPGKWDTSVGGHLDAGEDYLDAACRETGEELGFEPDTLEFAFAYKVRNQVESENIRTYLTRYDGEIIYQRSEIDEGRYWAPEEVDISLGAGLFTPVFESEYSMLMKSNLPHVRRYLGLLLK